MGLKIGVLFEVQSLDVHLAGVNASHHTAQVKLKRPVHRSCMPRET